MSESFYNMSEQIRQWYDLEHYFDGILIFNLMKREAPSAYTFEKSDVDDSDDVISRIDEAEKPYLPEVEAAIALIALSGEVDLDGFSLESPLSLAQASRDCCLVHSHAHDRQHDLVSAPAVFDGRCCAMASRRLVGRARQRDGGGSPDRFVVDSAERLTMRWSERLAALERLRDEL